MIVGIDLGTTNSLIGAFEGQAPRLFRNALDSFLTPSVVSIDDDGTVIVGQAARERLVTHPRVTVAACRALTQFDRVACVVAFFAYVTVISVLANASGLGMDPGLLPTFAIVLPAPAFWAFDWFRRGFLRLRTSRGTRNLRRSRPV